MLYFSLMVVPGLWSKDLRWWSWIGIIAEMPCVASEDVTKYQAEGHFAVHHVVRRKSSIL